MSAEAYMRRAIEEARKVMGTTHPNPAVGAVIVHDGKIVATGGTEPVGGAHAEVKALQAFADSGLSPDASTVMYVTMEPCSTIGRTGACTDPIARSGIRKLVAGATDRNPKHSGRGFDILREAGIEVVTGILEAECEELNLIFNWRMAHGGPFIAGKVATTIDGRIATRGGLSKWITSPPARQDVHRWRRYFPAIAVGAGTVLADDPSLSARLEGQPEWCPVRFVFDRNLITFKDGLHKVYADAWKDRTVIVTSTAREERVRHLSDAHGLRFWTVHETLEDGGLQEFCDRCRGAEIDGVFIEGGAHLLSSFLKHRFLHYLLAYRAPKLLADTSGLSPFMGQEPVSMQDTIALEGVRHETFGEDQLMRGFVVYPKG